MLKKKTPIILLNEALFQVSAEDVAPLRSSRYKLTLPVVELAIAHRSEEADL
jgi:hypothetical protein